MDMSGYAYALAEDNRRVADRNAGVADANARVAREWMAYAEKLKAKLSLVEQERDAMTARLRILQAQVHGLDTLQGKLAAELGKVSPRHPMISLHRREQIAEAAAQAAR
jgi:chromosome segregation ATPase